MTCEPSADSDQPGHLPSLIRVLAVHSIGSKGLEVSSCAQRRLRSDWADAQADLSLLWALMSFCWFCHAQAHFIFQWKEAFYLSHYRLEESQFWLLELRRLVSKMPHSLLILICQSMLKVYLSRLMTKPTMWLCAQRDSDQPGHPPSLIRVFAVCMKKPWVLSYPLSTQRRLWSDWADAQADLSLRWAHTHFVGFVMLRLIY